MLFPIIPDQLIFNIRNTKTDAKKFRDSLQSIGEYLALEVVTKRPKKQIFIQTITGVSAYHFLSNEIPVFVTIIISDTMLAIGESILNAIRVIPAYFPKKIFIITALASQYGVDQVLQEYPNIIIFTAALDLYINDRGYIIPGLGDAGNRSYGEKYVDRIMLEEIIFPK